MVVVAVAVGVGVGVGVGVVVGVVVAVVVVVVVVVAVAVGVVMAEDPDQLLTSHEVAAIFRVHERTVRRWYQSGQLDDCAILTPGGRLRYRADRIRARATSPQTSRPSVTEAQEILEQNRIIWLDKQGTDEGNLL